MDGNVVLLGIEMDIKTESDCKLSRYSKYCKWSTCKVYVNDATCSKIYRVFPMVKRNIER
jgi:hypothetical protein